jgi:hypothetical protein
MQELNNFGRILIFFGGLLLLVGTGFLLVGKLPWIGRLPGDLYIERKNFTFYFPVTTGLLISLLLSLFLWFISRR